METVVVSSSQSLSSLSSASRSDCGARRRPSPTVHLARFMGRRGRADSSCCRCSERRTGKAGAGVQCVNAVSGERGLSWCAQRLRMKQNIGPSEILPAKSNSRRTRQVEPCHDKRISASRSLYSYWARIASRSDAYSATTQNSQSVTAAGPGQAASTPAQARCHTVSIDDARGEPPALDTAEARAAAAVAAGQAKT